MLCNRFFMEINTVMKQLKPQSIKHLSDDYTSRTIFIFILHWQNSLTACICISPQAGGKRAEYTVGGGGAAQADGYTATKLPRWISEWFCSRKKTLYIVFGQGKSKENRLQLSRFALGHSYMWGVCAIIPLK